MKFYFKIKERVKQKMKSRTNAWEMHRAWGIILSVAMVFNLLQAEPAMALYSGNVASVTIDGTTTYYADISKAWSSAQSGAATLTLLSDVTVSEILTTSENSNITLDCGGHTLTGSGQNTIKVNDGSLTVKGGTVVNTEGYGSAVFVTCGSGKSSVLSVEAGAVIEAAYGEGIYLTQSASLGSSAVVDVYGTVNGAIAGVNAYDGTLNVYPGAVILGSGDSRRGGGYGIDTVSADITLNGGTITGSLNAIYKDGQDYIKKEINIADGMTAMLGETVLTSPITESTAAGTVTVVCSGPHALGKDLDADGMVTCTECCAKVFAAAKVEKEGQDTIYIDENSLGSVFAEDSGNEGAVITLLKDVERSSDLRIKIDCTLDLGGHTIFMTGDTGVTINGRKRVVIKDKIGGKIISEGYNGLTVIGSATLEGGTFISGGAQYCGVNVCSEDAVLSVTGKNVVVQNTGGGPGLCALFAGSVNLSAGEYSGGGGAVYVSENCPELTIGSFLGHTDGIRYAYFENNEPIKGKLGEKVLAGTVSVKVCEHYYEYEHAAGSAVHSKSCPACGIEGAEENCSYDAGGKCACGSALEVTLPDMLNLTYNGMEQKPVITVTVDNIEIEGYDAVYTDNINAGKANVTVTGRDGYNFTKELAFSIAPAVLTPEITETIDKIYDGTNTVLSDCTITLKGIVGNDDVVATAASCTYDNFCAGTHTITAEGITLSGKDVVNYGLSSTTAYTSGIINKADQPAPDAPSATDENTKDTSITLTAVENAEYSRDGVTWQDSPVFSGLDPDSEYRFVARYKEDENHNASPNSGWATIYTKKPMLENADVTVGGTYTYTGNAIIPSAADVDVELAGQTVDRSQYTISFSENINAGTAKVTVTAIPGGDYSGSAIGTFTIGKATLTAVGHGAAKGTYGVKLSDLAVTGLEAYLSGTLIGGTWELTGDAKPDAGDAGPYTAVFRPETGEDNYKVLTADVTLDISKATGILTVPEASFTKKYGADKKFTLNCTANGDGIISYKSDNEAVAEVSADGEVTIKGAGTADITVSLSEGKNYTSAQAKTVTITVEKADAPIVKPVTEKYIHMCGSGGEVVIDVAGKLPGDCGETSYAVTTSDAGGILSGVDVDGKGSLSFAVEEGKAIGNTASITVTAEMANYANAEFTVNIEIVDKIAVGLRDGSSVSIKGSNTLTYGQALSGLEFSPAIFVEQGTSTEVKGTLAWKAPQNVPDTGTKTAEWVFVPENSSKYAEMTGTVAISVVKATPEVEMPETDAVIYNPNQTLGSIGLSGGKATWTVGGTPVTVEGTWAWADSTVVPASGNSGYTAVFMPKDTANYNSVKCTVAVPVSKAEPYVTGIASAGAITYGDTLGKSVLTGTAVYSSSDSTPVSGSFAWKDADVKPQVTDSGITKYAVVFTPDDKTNYSTVETEVSLTVEKAENAPNMPPAAISAAKTCGKVGDVALPADWKWQDSDRDTDLKFGILFTATAVYIGEDKENYRNVTAAVGITRAECEHENKELRDAVAASCTEDGYTGDTFCTDCNTKISSGTVITALGHSYKSKVTKEPTGTETGVRTYTCTRCTHTYTEVIPKLDTPIVTKAEREKNEVAMNSRLKASQTGSKINISWGSVTGADGYDVYVQYSDKKFTSKNITSIKKGNVTKATVKKVGKKALDLKKTYKAYVLAYRIDGGRKVTLGKSMTAYIAGRNNKKYTNAKAVKTDKNSYKLKKGKKAKIKAKVVLTDKKKKQLTKSGVKKFLYISSNKKVATVSANGTIKAVGKGKCYIYTCTINGYAKKIKVTVS